MKKLFIVLQSRAPHLSWGLLVLVLIGLPLSPFIVTLLAKHGADIVLVSGWKELVLLLAAMLALFNLKSLKAQNLAFLASGLYLLYLAVDFVLRGHYDQAAVAGLLINSRFIIAFAAAYTVALQLPKARIATTLGIKLVTTIIVAVAAGLILVLPNSLLVGAGYDAAGVDRVGVPAAAYYVSPDFPLERAQSTLRSPNSLGLFLLLPIALSLFSPATFKNRQLRWGSFSLFTLVLLLTYSRAAWLGLGLILLVAAVRLGLPRLTKLNRRVVWPVGLLAAGLAVAIVMVSIGTPTGRSLVLHQAENQANGSSSARLDTYYQSVEEIVKQPLGTGSGSVSAAGRLESANIRSSENYYLQLARELGVIGVLAFLLLSLVMLLSLWRQASPFRLSLLVSFMALCIANLFLPVWAEEAVSISWWLVAGLSLGFYSRPGSSTASSRHRRTSVTKKIQPAS